MHKTKNNKFFWLWRYKIKIQLYNVCILSDVWLKVANYILRSSNVRYPNWGASDVEYSTFDGRPIESKKSYPSNKTNRIEFATFDLTECTRLIIILCKLLPQGSCREKNQTPGKNISMILRLEMILSAVSYERKDIIFFMKKIWNLKIIPLIRFFEREFSITIASY